MKKMRQKNENSTCAVLKSSTKVAADAASIVVTRQIFTLFNPYPKNFTIRERHHFII